MRSAKSRCILAAGLLLLSLVEAACTARAAPEDPLASWNNGNAKRSILSFVAAITDSASSDYVAPEERIATFDQDGTIWVEQPLYPQSVFILDRIRALAPHHPEWKNQQPFRAVITNPRGALSLKSFSKKDWTALLLAAESGMGLDSFHALAAKWLAFASSPRFHRPYTDLVYQPMRELMQFLRANGFRTYIVTGGDQEFVRVYSRRAYGIPPEQVIGSSLGTRYTMQNGLPVLMRTPEIFLVDDREGKPIGVNLFTGRRPLMAFGNSEGDEDLLKWTRAGGRRRLAALVYHDDAAREYAYGPAGGLPSNGIGTFPQPLMDEAKRCGWTVISIKRDWKRLFAWQR